MRGGAVVGALFCVAKKATGDDPTHLDEGEAGHAIIRERERERERGREREREGVKE